MILRGKLNGAKLDTEAMEFDASQIGRGAFCQRRRYTGRSAGAGRSENAGMSSVKHVRTVFTEYLRFPTPGQSASG